MIDWQSGEQWQIPIGHPVYDCTISNAGRWLTIPTVANEDDERTIATVVIDVAGRRIARRLAGRVLAFIRDDELAVCCSGKHKIEIMDMVTGLTTASFEPDIDFTDLCLGMVCSPDGRWIAFGHLDFWREIGTLRDVEVWDVVVQRCVFRRVKSSHWMPGSVSVAFPAAGGRGAAWEKDGQDLCLSLFEPAKTPPVTSVSIPRHLALGQDGEDNTPRDPRIDAGFSPNGNVFIVNSMSDRETRVTAFDAASGRGLWYKTQFSFNRFLGQGELVLGYGTQNKGPLVLDAMSGMQRAAISSDTPVTNPPWLSHNQFIVMSGFDDVKRPTGLWERWLQKLQPQWRPDSRSVLAVVEPSTGSDLLRLRGVSGNTKLSDDGRTLVTWTFSHLPPRADTLALGFQVWDVNPNRAYFWAITWSLGVGVLLLLWRRWRVKRKAARAQVQAAG